MLISHKISSFKTIRTDMTQTAKTISVAQKPRWKWSGSDEPQSYYGQEDNDTVTMTKEEIAYIRWYHAQAKKTWHNTDED